MTEPRIINCHIHTFTIDHVPTWKVPILTQLLRFPPVRAVFRGLLSTLIFWDERDRLRRFSEFVKMTYGSTQEIVFKEVRTRYPKNTQFVVLAMDMFHMGAGKPRKDLEVQMEELADLRDRHPDVVRIYLKTVSRCSLRYQMRMHAS